VFTGETLVGSWDLIGFTDAGVPDTTSGTAVFRPDGTFEVDGTVTFPGEPPDPILVDGTYHQSGSTPLAHATCAPQLYAVVQHDRPGHMPPACSFSSDQAVANDLVSIKPS
jgi:hypothetical protein